jgi:hypothetical protein
MKFPIFKYLLLTVFLFVIFSCRQTIQTDQLELKQIYYDILSADSLRGKYYLIDSIENFGTKTIKQSDTTYLIAECNSTKSGIWTDNINDSLVIISKEKLHSKAKGDQFAMTPANYSFSLPYFSKDKQTFIIYYNHYCGNLCAEYSLRLYKKINGKWTFVKTYFSMVS